MPVVVIPVIIVVGALLGVGGICVRIFGERRSLRADILLVLAAGNGLSMCDIRRKVRDLRAGRAPKPKGVPTAPSDIDRFAPSIVEVSDALRRLMDGGSVTSAYANGLDRYALALPTEAEYVPVAA